MNEGAPGGAARWSDSRATWSRHWDVPRLGVSLALGIATGLLLFALSSAWITAHRPVVTLTGGLCNGGVNPVVVNDGQGVRSLDGGRAPDGRPKLRLSPSH